MNPTQIIKQGDYYEISGPEESQDQKRKGHVETIKSENIEVLNISTKEAFQKLNLSQYKKQSQNKQEQCTKESPGERYKRIKEELEEFQKDMEEQKKNEVGQNFAQEDTNIKIVDEIAKMQKELQSISEIEGVDTILAQKNNIEFSLETNIGLLNKNKQNLLNQQFEDYVKKYKPQSEEQAKYLEFYSSKYSGLKTNENYLLLEKRLKSLEKQLLSQQNHKNLLKTVQNIQDNLVKLDENKLQDLQKKIATLQEPEISSQNRYPSRDEISKIQEISQKFQKYIIIQQEIPYMIQKMESLFKIHEDSAKFIEEIKETSNNISQIKQRVDQREQLLQESDKNFDENLKQFETNLEQLNARISKLGL